MQSVVYLTEIYIRKTHKTDSIMKQKGYKTNLRSNHPLSGRYIKIRLIFFDFLPFFPAVYKITITIMFDLFTSI